MYNIYFTVYILHCTLYIDWLFSFIDPYLVRVPSKGSNVFLHLGDRTKIRFHVLFWLLEGERSCNFVSLSIDKILPISVLLAGPTGLHYQGPSVDCNNAGDGYVGGSASVNVVKIMMQKSIFGGWHHDAGVNLFNAQGKKACRSHSIIYCHLVWINIEFCASQFLYWRILL